MKKLRNIILGLLIFALLPFSITACGNEDNAETDGGVTTLWVVTEQTDSGGFNDQVQLCVEAFERQNSGTRIQLDILPTAAEERDVYLERLRSEIMAGKGPDVFLLPTVYFSSMESVFNDVEQAMYNGLFADISHYYDADTDLRTGELVDAVMDAGVLGEARYVLPLRYDFPVIYADKSLLEESGLDLETMASSVTVMMDEVLANGGAKWCHGASLNLYNCAGWFSYLPEVVDYESDKVVLSADTVGDFCLRYQAISERNGSYIHSVVGNTRSYISSGSTLNAKYPMEISLFSWGMDYAAIAKVEGTEVTMIPLRAMDGDLVANVTYYAAVGAGSDTPELAYQFIRNFLMESYQWEQNRTIAAHSFGLIEAGWPVRSKGAASYLWEVRCQQNQRIAATEEGERPRQKHLQVVSMTDEDIPILDAQIDRVRFNTNLERQAIKSMISMLNDYETGEASDTDIGTLAEDLIQELRWHVAEG